jgi:sugar lactone lactonase YvrE
MNLHHWLIPILALVITNIPKAALAIRPLGDSKLFTDIPSTPGFPEDVEIFDNRVFVSGPAQSGLFVQPSVLEFNLDSGAFVRKYDITGQNPALPQAIAGMVFDKDGQLYVTDIQQGVVRFDVTDPNPNLEIYSSALPDLPICSSVVGESCSPTTEELPALVNDTIFDPNGNLYLSDSFQGTIWRVPSGGGAPEIWFQDSRLDGFGANALRVDPTGKTLYVATTANLLGEGFVRKIPLVDEPSAEDLSDFFKYSPGESPAGLEFGASGNLYVVLGKANQVSVLSPDGLELNRFSGPASRPNDPDNPLEWRNPSNATFNSKERSLLVTNNPLPTIADDQTEFSVFDLFVDDVAVGFEDDGSVSVPEPRTLVGLTLFLGLSSCFTTRHRHRRSNI